MTGLDPTDKQGDRRIIDILREFGAKVEATAESTTASMAELRPREIDLADSPDLFPIVCVLATRASGRTRIFNAEHVRLKESDRIRSTTDFLRAMGARIEENRDGCVVDGPCRLKGSEVDSLGDHRILMAAAVAALIAEGETIISDGDCYKVSYPSFIQDMRALGARMEVID